MSTIKVTNLRGRNGSPTLPDGAVVTGVATATTFDGSLKTTGTPTLGLGVTINSSGVAISGVLTATTLKGDGSNLTGVGESIAPYYYNPDVNGTAVPITTGIGITFNKKVVAGSGTATLKIVNAGVAGTTIQSWGISSATFPSTAVESFSLGSLVSNLVINKTYQLDIPEGFVVSSTGTNYAGTAYTFTSEGAFNKLFTFGLNTQGQLGHNSPANSHLSSPVQIPGATAWKAGWGESNHDDGYSSGAIKTDGTLWTWGKNSFGVMGVNTPSSNPTAAYSSPVQVGTDTTWSQLSMSGGMALAIKTDNTLWGWGGGGSGALGQNDVVSRSSPIQIPGTTWSYVANSGSGGLALRTDGTLWAWGYSASGRLGLNANVDYSSPVQVPGTNWSKIAMRAAAAFGLKTDGTLWAWGDNDNGGLGLNAAAPVKQSSPTQIPGTNWALISGRHRGGIATKTDGTLWVWGYGWDGGLGVPSVGENSISSPVQVPGTTWPTSGEGKILGEYGFSGAIKTDGTLWMWGAGQYGQTGQNNLVKYSSPVQVGSNTDWDQIGGFAKDMTMAIQKDETP